MNWANISIPLPRSVAVSGYIHIPTIIHCQGIGAVITRIAVDPANPMTAYVTLGGFSGSLNPSSHVFKTTNGGHTWADVSGNLPDIPVNQVVVDPDVRGTVYVATDIGVFYTRGGGERWHPLVKGLPRVVVNDLVLHRASRTLRAATHGRSMWDLRLPSKGGR